MKKYNLSEEGRAVLVATQSKPKTEQIKSRMSEAHKGKRFTAEHKAALSTANLSTGTKLVVALGTIYSSGVAASSLYKNIWRKVKNQPEKFAYL